MKIRFLAILLILSLHLTYAQKKISCSFLNNSRLSISGTSNIVPYKLTQDAKCFLCKNMTFTATKIDDKVYLSVDKLNIPVKNFTSDNPFILPDFRKLLKSDQFPHLSIQLLFIETNDEDLKSGNSSGNINVNITIAGQTRQLKIPVLAKQTDNLMSITGEKKINIHDFGLQAPIDPFGIIKVNEWIKIDFNIHFKYALID